MQPKVQDITATDESDSFLGPICASCVSAVQENSTKWTKSLEIYQHKMTFKIDTGADVTVIPLTMSLQQQDSNPLKSRDTLWDS